MKYQIIHLDGTVQTRKWPSAQHHWKRASSLARMRQISLYTGFDEEQGKLILSDGNNRALFDASYEGLSAVRRALGDYSTEVII